MLIPQLPHQINEHFFKVSVVRVVKVFRVIRVVRVVRAVNFIMCQSLNVEIFSILLEAQLSILEIEQGSMIC